VATGVSNWHTRSAGPPTPPPPWVPVPKYIGWLCSGNRRSLLSEGHSEYARQFLGLSGVRPNPALNRTGDSASPRGRSLGRGPAG
jgi:hypothetical protein